MRGVFAVLMMSALLFAGCLEGTEEPSTLDAVVEEAPEETVDESATEETEEVPEEAVEDGNTTEQADETQEEAEEVAENLAPTAAIVTNGTEVVVGEALAVTLEGEDDGESLSWTVDTNGDGEAEFMGEELPADIELVFETLGEHLVVLTVSDGELETVAEAFINVVEPPCEVESFEGAVAVGPLWIAQDGPTSGSVWVYEESNGIPGLQRDDSVVANELCGNPSDTIIF